MKIEGRTTFEAAPAEVWEVLLDPRAIADAVPGCERMTEVGPDTFDVALRVGLGAVSGSFAGRMRIVEKESPKRYSMTFEGDGKQGFARGAGEVRLAAEGSATVVTYRCDVEVGGLIASVGQRVLEGVSKYLVGQMFAKLERTVAERAGRGR